MNGVKPPLPSASTKSTARIARLERDVGISIETLALFVRFG